jgi:D-arabinitol 4-dehydrogenase
VETIAPDGQTSYQRITALTEVLPWQPDLAPLVARGAAPDVEIISFTVTEAGYYLDDHHRLDASHADVRNDLAGEPPRTLYGALAAILGARMHTGGGPVTLMNCDNLRSNGERFRAGFLDFLQRRGEAALHAWVLQHTTCPCAMVDRITPRPAPEVAQRVLAATGWADAAPVMGEPFLQWVIEDHFAAGRPAWEKVGVQLVDSVLPFEEAKIRLLNAPHSCIAWAGTLKGLRYIHEGTVQPAIRQMAFDYATQDVLPALQASTAPAPYPLDLAAYRDVVLHRFSNPFLNDTNQRVAMDGFSKIPGFIVPTLRERLAQGASIARTAVLPALFFHFLQRWHQGELPYEYQDGVMDRAAAHAFFKAADPLAAFAADATLWGPLAGDARLLAALRVASAEVQAFVDAA